MTIKERDFRRQWIWTNLCSVNKKGIELDEYQIARPPSYNRPIPDPPISPQEVEQNENPNDNEAHGVKFISPNQLIIDVPHAADSSKSPRCLCGEVNKTFQILMRFRQISTASNISHSAEP